VIELRSVVRMVIIVFGSTRWRVIVILNLQIVTELKVAMVVFWKLQLMCW
jgi:hypothetical protein